jgi:hypothetical protein
VEMLSPTLMLFENSSMMDITLFWRSHLQRYLLVLFLTCGVNLVYAQNFGLYGERIGTLSIVTQNKDETERVLSQVHRVFFDEDCLTVFFHTAETDCSTHVFQSADIWS